MPPTNADWHYFVQYFDEAIDLEESKSEAEDDANDAYRRLLSDASFRHHVLELIAIGPGGQSLQAEIERAYKRETTPPAATYS